MSKKMTHRNSTHQNILPAILSMRRNLWLLLGIIWCFALPAAGYVYFSNTGFIDFKANVFNVRAPAKNNPDKYSNNNARSKENPFVKDAYLLVLYNTKLMLTRYTGLDARPGNVLAPVPLGGTKKNTPVIIKRPTTLTGQPNDFSVKPVPQ
jgi:hypothetical protein